MGKTGPLLNRASKQVTNNADKAEVLNTFFSSAFTGIAGPQITGSSSYDPCQPSISGERAGLRPKSSTHVNLVPDGIRPRVLREITDVVARPLSIIRKYLKIIFEKGQGMSPMTGRSVCCMQL